MAKIDKPKKGTKGLPPEDKESNNLDKTGSCEKVNMNFKMLPEFKREFSNYAVDCDLKKNELLEACFSYFKSKKAQ